MKEEPPQRPLTFHFGPGVLHDFRAARDKELLVTNGWGVRPGLSARRPWPGPSRKAIITVAAEQAPGRIIMEIATIGLGWMGANIAERRD